MENICKSIVALGNVYKPVMYNGETGDLYINPIDDFENILMDLRDKFITSNYADTFAGKQRQEDLILDLYNETMDFTEGIPSLDDVMSFVQSYNWDIIKDIALIDYANDYSEIHSRNCVSQENIDEYINDLAFEWNNSLFIEFFGDLDEWVMQILNERNMSYYASSESSVEILLNKVPNIQVVFNDCQNLINSEWITVGMNYLDQYSNINLTRVKVVNT